MMGQLRAGSVKLATEITIRRSVANKKKEGGICHPPLVLGSADPGNAEPTGTV
jgi:hypothetical protein